MRPYLKLIIGPMFSSKSTKLIELINYKILIIKNSLDTRYSNVSQIILQNKYLRI